MPRNKKFKKVILLYCYIVILFFCLVIIRPAAAQDTAQLEFTPNISISSGFQKGEAQQVDESTLGNYIAAWYGFVIGTVGILAAIMIMYGGIKWMTSRGGQAVSEAKDIIFSALIGLTLAFLSYTILNLVNPNLLKLGLPSLSKMTAIQYAGDFNIVPINPGSVDFSGLAKSTGNAQVAADIGTHIAQNEGGYVLNVYPDLAKPNLMIAGAGHQIKPDEMVEVIGPDGQPIMKPGSQLVPMDRNNPSAPHDQITENQAQRWMSQDLNDTYGAVSNDIRAITNSDPNNLYPLAAQQVAADVYYQYGAAGVGENFPGFSEAMSARNWDEAARILNTMGGRDDNNNITNGYITNYESRARENISLLNSL